MTAIAAVLVNYGSHQLIAANLRPDALADAGITVVVVDNYSSAEERQSVTDLCARHGWHLVACANDGFAAGLNKGVARAMQSGCRAVVAINPDAVVEVPVLLNLGEQALREPRSLVSPRMLTSTGDPHFRGAQVNMRNGAIRSGWCHGDGDPVWKNWLSGACLAFHVDAHGELSGLDEGYFLYWEDVDLSRRAAASLMELCFREDLTVVHDEGGTQGWQRSRAKSPGYYYYNTRNRLRFATRHCSRAELREWIMSTPRQSLNVWLRGGRRQLLASPKGAVYAAGGTFRGLALAIRVAFARGEAQ